MARLGRLADIDELGENPNSHGDVHPVLADPGAVVFLRLALLAVSLVFSALDTLATHRVEQLKSRVEEWLHGTLMVRFDKHRRFPRREVRGERESAALS